MGRHTSIRELLTGYPGQDTNPTLHDPSGPVEEPRTPVEDIIAAVLPGDDVQKHPLYTPPNPFLFMPLSQLLAAIKGGQLPPDEHKQALSALRRLEAAEGGHLR